MLVRGMCSFTSSLLVPNRRLNSCQHEGPFIAQGLGPHVLGSSPTTASPHCPCGPLKWQVAELIVEGAHFQV